MQNPRECALDVLIKVDKKEELSHIAISNVLEKYQFSEKRDRAFFTRLVEGTLERQITIDYVADQFSKTNPERKPKPTESCIASNGIYQILYMDQVPDSAACNEAVKLAKKRGFSRLSGFVNGVLRNISRKKDEIQYPSRKNLETYLSVVYSIPEWIIKFFQKTYDNETVEDHSFLSGREKNNIMLSDLQGWERSCQKRTGSRRRYSRRWKFDRKCSADLRL